MLASSISGWVSVDEISLIIDNVVGDTHRSGSSSEDDDDDDDHDDDDDDDEKWFRSQDVIITYKLLQPTNNLYAPTWWL